MPYKLIPALAPRIDPNFVAAIAQELRLQRPDGPANAPAIIEEQVPRSDRLYVTVVWDEWNDISPEDRGRIILDAYERVRGTDIAQRISVALGLTHTESQRLGVAI